MNFQNLFNMFNNFTPQQNGEQPNQPQQNSSFSLYPESFTTSDFYQSAKSNNGNYNNNNNNDNYSKPPQNILNGLLGPNANISSLMPLLSLFNGKQGLGSILSSDKLPETFKGLSPFLSLLNSGEKAKEEDSLSIDKLKKIDD